MSIFRGLVLVLLAFFMVFIYYSGKIKDKFGISMIVGQIGSGKSSIICSLIRKYQKKGWHVYADFVTNIPGCRYYNPKNLDECAPEKNSVLFIDESSLCFSSRDFKNFGPYMEFTALCRHFENHLILSSQSFDVDLYIRNRVKNMYLVKRYGCISVMRKIKKLQTVLSAESLSNSTDVKNSGLIDGYKYERLTAKDGIHFYWLPSLWKWHDSFYLTPRSPLPFTVPVPIVEKEKFSLRKRLRMLLTVGKKRYEQQEITSASEITVLPEDDIGAEGDTVNETRMELLG